MSKTVHKYRVFCNTENTYVYTWDDLLPTLCPNDGKHTIDTSTIVSIDTVESGSVNIIQEQNPTGGWYRTESKRMTIKPNSTEVLSMSWPYPISILELSLNSSTENDGDIINSYVAKDTVIGVVSQSIPIGTNIAHVSDTVVQNIYIGFLVSFQNATTGQIYDMGECIEIDTSNKTITCSKNCLSEIPMMSYVRMTINNIKHFVIKGGLTYNLGRKSLQASYLPKNTKVDLSYQNLSMVQSKTFSFVYEYLY